MKIDMQFSKWNSVYSTAPFSNECPRYDIKQSDNEALVMLGLWGMQNIPSLPSLSGFEW